MKKPVCFSLWTKSHAKVFSDLVSDGQVHKKLVVRMAERGLIGHDTSTRPPRGFRPFMELSALSTTISSKLENAQ